MKSISQHMCSPSSSPTTTCFSSLFTSVLFSVWVLQLFAGQHPPATHTHTHTENLRHILTHEDISRHKERSHSATVQRDSLSLKMQRGPSQISPNLCLLIVFMSHNCASFCKKTSDTKLTGQMWYSPSSAGPSNITKCMSHRATEPQSSGDIV